MKKMWKKPVISTKSSVEIASHIKAAAYSWEGFCNYGVLR